MVLCLGVGWKAEANLSVGGNSTPSCSGASCAENLAEVWESSSLDLGFKLCRGQIAHTLQKIPKAYGHACVGRVALQICGWIASMPR